MSAVTLIATSFEDFEAQLQPGYDTEDFEGVTPGLQPSSFVRSGGGYEYTISTPSRLWVAETKFSKWMSNDETADSVVLTFSSEATPVTAVGGTFFLTRLNGSAVEASFTLSLSDGTTQVVNSQAQTADSQPYVGFLSTVPITSLTLVSPNLADAFVTLDNITVGTATVVPEPVEAALAVGVGLAAFGVWQRRWRRRR